LFQEIVWGSVLITPTQDNKCVHVDDVVLMICEIPINTQKHTDRQLLTGILLAQPA